MLVGTACVDAACRTPLLLLPCLHRPGLPAVAVGSEEGAEEEDGPGVARLGVARLGGVERSTGLTFTTSISSSSSLLEPGAEAEAEAEVVAVAELRSRFRLPLGGSLLSELVERLVPDGRLLLLSVSAAAQKW